MDNDDEEKDALLSDYSSSTPSTEQLKVSGRQHDKCRHSGDDSSRNDVRAKNNWHHKGSKHERLIAIFVVAFDIKAGNLIEWCMPEEIDLEGIEFKAMASGSHRLYKDFVYFRKNNLFGLACFENMKVSSELERGARMKSVGVLATSFKNLHIYMQFLETQVTHLLQNPGNYSELAEFWEENKGILPSPFGQYDENDYSNTSQTFSNSLKITHPAGCFTQFLQFFDVNIFVLWKFALLKKRILFYSPPPVGIICYRVYCTCALAKHALQQTFPNVDTQPHFYVNVADIETLEMEVSYIACTTEKVFEDKANLYDIYVDNQNIQCPSPCFSDICKINDSDKQRLRKLAAFRSSYNYRFGETDADQICLRFFEEENRKIFESLLEHSSNGNRSLTAKHIIELGFDPHADRIFLMELTEAYGIDVNLVVDTACCLR